MGNEAKLDFGLGRRLTYVQVSNITPSRFSLFLLVGGKPGLYILGTCAIAPQGNSAGFVFYFSPNYCYVLSGLGPGGTSVFFSGLLGNQVRNRLYRTPIVTLARRRLPTFYSGWPGIDAAKLINAVSNN